MENIKLEKIGHWARIRKEKGKFLVELQPMEKNNSLPNEKDWYVGGIDLDTEFDTLEQAKKFIELENKYSKHFSIDNLISRVQL